MQIPYMKITKLTAHFVNHFYSEVISRAGCVGNFLIVLTEFGRQFKNRLILQMIAAGCTITNDPNLWYDPVWAILLGSIFAAGLLSAYLLYGKKTHWSLLTQPSESKIALYEKIVTVQESLEAFVFLGLTLITRLQPVPALIIWLMALPMMSWPFLSHVFLHVRGSVQSYFTEKKWRAVYYSVAETLFNMVSLAAIADALLTAITIIQEDEGAKISEYLALKRSNLTLMAGLLVGFLGSLGNYKDWCFLNLFSGVLSDFTYPLLFWMSYKDCDSNAMHNSFIVEATFLGAISLFGYLPVRWETLMHESTADSHRLVWQKTKAVGISAYHRALRFFESKNVSVPLLPQNAL